MVMREMVKTALLWWYLFCRSAMSLEDRPSQCAGRSSNVTDIYIIGFFPCTDPNDTRGIPVDNCDGIERIPIMKLALEEISERCDLLPGYRLVVDYANSNCSSVPATYHLIQLTDPSQPTKLMILGPACSVANEVMGEVAERYLNITQVSYTASSSVFADIIRYPRFFRFVPIAEEFAEGFVAVIKELKWKRVAVISYIDEFMLKLKRHTETVLRENDVNVILEFTYSDDTLNSVSEHIKQVDARIIIAWLPPSPNKVVAEFWCMIVKSKLFGGQFVWMFPGWFEPQWWTNVKDTLCTSDEMKSALDYSLGFRGNDELKDDNSRMLISEKNVSQYLTDLQNLSDVKQNINTLLSIGYVYDAVWTIALALNSSISILEGRGLGRLEDFTYESVEMANVFTEAVANVSFPGISGNVSFKDGNRSNASLQILQYFNGTVNKMLIYKPSSANYKLSNISELEWKDGKVPRDAPVPIILTSTLAEYIIIGVAASVGILSSIFFFVFNIYYKNHLVVKQSSYRLNSLIIVGVCLGFVGDLIYVIKLDPDMSETLTSTLCNARVWTSKLAFVIAFGALFIKIWRLYRLFFNKKMVERKYLGDKHLFIMVALIVAPTLVILIIQATAFPLRLHADKVSDENTYSTTKIYLKCEGKNQYVFLAIFHIGQGLLVFLTILVAYETKKHIPKIKKYRKYYESAVINLTTILAILLSSVCEVVLIIFQLNRINDGVLLIVTLRDCLWMYPMIYLLFIPKVYRVYSISIARRFSTVNSIIPSRLRSGSFVSDKRKSSAI